MLQAAGDYFGSLPDYDAKVASRLPATVLCPLAADEGINRQKRALIDGADISHRWHANVNKALPVFREARTVLGLLINDESVLVGQPSATVA